LGYFVEKLFNAFLRMHSESDLGIAVGPQFTAELNGIAGK